MQTSQLSNLRIAGVALLLFSSVLLGVGIHHLVATGTCSSTGYSANYGPVPTCPSGTGWWFAFVFGGVIGSLIGAAMASRLGLVFAGIFGGIGFGSLSILLDSHAHSSNKTFGAVFGGCFAIVGVGAAVSVLSSAIGSLRSRAGRRSPPPAPATTSAFGTPDASTAFGNAGKDVDPIISAYNASHAGTPAAPAPASARPASGAPASPVTPLSLLPRLDAIRQAAAGDPLDELGKLAELHKNGGLTDEEFSRAKAKLLGEM